MITARPTPLVVRGSRPGHATQYEAPARSVRRRTHVPLLDPAVVAEAVRIAKEDRLREELAAYAARKGAVIEPLPRKQKAPLVLPDAVFDPAKCGEYRGYRQHWRYGTPVCGPCEEASRVYAAGHRAKVRAAREAAKKLQATK